jgi:hypothetical protein
MLQYQENMADEKMDNLNLAAANHFKLMGALEFVRLMKTIHIQNQQPVSTARSGSLNHNA